LRVVAESFPDTASAGLSTCDKFIVPACIRALYNIPEVPEYPSSRPRADDAMGIFEESDFYLQEDLDLFFLNFTSQIPNGTHPTPAFIDGAEIPTEIFAGGESDLDFQLAYPLIYPQAIKLYQKDDFNYAINTHPGTGLFNTFLDALDGVSVDLS
jgi:tripeptidyl-peptidase-1